MGHHEDSVATALIKMPPSGVARFLRRSLRERNLSITVQRLNREMQSDQGDVAEKAAAALGKLGFVDLN